MHVYVYTLCIMSYDNLMSGAQVDGLQRTATRLRDVVSKLEARIKARVTLYHIISYYIDYFITYYGVWRARGVEAGGAHHGACCI